jgi:S1-C subfamily serine protease
MRALLAALLAASALAGCSSKIDPMVTSSYKASSANIRIDVASGGVGSGVYIGNGVVLTAAHVVGGFANVKLKDDAGEVQDGTVLWRNTTYDIAVVRPTNSSKFRAADLSCRSPAVGEHITAWGNPAGLDAVTMQGYVSGAERELGDKWKSAFLTDLTTIGGMSGGPTYDEYGYVVGITVGTMSFNGPAGGLGFAVPGSVVCELLGRV